MIAGNGTANGSGGSGCMVHYQMAPTPAGTLQTGSGCERCCSVPVALAPASGVHTPCDPDLKGTVPCTVDVIVGSQPSTTSPESPIVIPFTVDLSGIPAQARIISVEVHNEVQGGGPIVLTLTNSQGVVFGSASLPAAVTPSGAIIYVNADGCRAIGAAAQNPNFGMRLSMTFSVPPPGMLKVGSVWVGWCGDGAYWPGDL